MKPIRTRSNPLVVLLALLASAVSASGGVLVVDKANGPGADYTEIQAAVTAALEGDTILVRDGSYAGVLIIGKSLSIVAEGAAAFVPGNILSEPAVLVRNLAPGQSVLVRGLRSGPGVVVRDCEGSVWFDELVVTGDVACAIGGSAGANVARSSKVTFTRCTLRGESNSDFWFIHPSAEGLRLEQASVQLFDCMIQGGWGQSVMGFAFSPLAGGSGIRIDASTVTIVGCTVQGGEGGLASGLICDVVHEPGGAGVEFVGTAGVVRSAESTAVGGIASLEPFCPGMTGPPGPAISGTGTIVALPGFARHLRANSPVRGGATLTFELEGQPGELPLLFVSGEHEPIPMLNGTLLVGLPPSDVFVLAPLPATGQGALAFPVPNVGAAVASLTFYAQAVFLDPTPAIWLGAGTTVVLLDASF